MENTNYKHLHLEVQKKLFQILVDYRILEINAYTYNHKLPLYNLSHQHKLLKSIKSAEMEVFITSVDRLLETKFVYLIKDNYSHSLFLIKQHDYEKLSDEDKNNYSLKKGKSASVLVTDEVFDAINSLDGNL